MLQRASLLSAEKRMLDEWELEDAEMEMETQSKAPQTSTRTNANIFDMENFLNERNVKVQSASELRQERITKDMELRSLLLDED
jgi:hypothetical protein